MHERHSIQKRRCNDENMSGGMHDEVVLLQRSVEYKGTIWYWNVSGE
jgi:hypothetical protein